VTQTTAGPAWRRRLAVLLAAAIAALVALAVLLDDGRFLDAALRLGAALVTVLLIGGNRPVPPRDPGRSPWTPPALLAVAATAGPAAGLALLGVQIDDPAPATTVLVAVLLLLVVDLAVLVAVLVRGQLRGESWRARVFPDLPDADRHRVRLSAVAVGGSIYAAIVVSPWLEGELRFWIPVAIACALAPALLLWWVTRLASTAAGGARSGR
jgi:hypothetical protein